MWAIQLCPCGWGGYPTGGNVYGVVVSGGHVYLADGAAGVLVLDAEQLDRLAVPLDNPERVVLITKNDPRALSRAWEAGVNSVVFDKDPLNTTVLAVMSARLRSQKKA